MSRQPAKGSFRARPEYKAMPACARCSGSVHNDTPPDSNPVSQTDCHTRQVTAATCKCPAVAAEGCRRRTAKYRHQCQAPPPQCHPDRAGNEVRPACRRTPCRAGTPPDRQPARRGTPPDHPAGQHEQAEHPRARRRYNRWSGPAYAAVPVAPCSIPIFINALQS